MRRLLRVNWDNPITRGLVHLSPGGDDACEIRYDAAAGRRGTKATSGSTWSETRRTRWGDMRLSYHNISSRQHAGRLLRKGSTTGDYSGIVIGARAGWTAGNTGVFNMYGPSGWSLIILGTLDSSGVQVAQAQTTITGSVQKTVTGTNAIGATAYDVYMLGGRVRYGVGLDLFLNGKPEGTPESFTDVLRDAADQWQTSQQPGYVGIAAGWLRALSNDEFAILNADPWQLFDNTSERTYFWLPQTEQSYSLDVDNAAFSLTGQTVTSIEILTQEVSAVSFTGQDVVLSAGWSFDEALYPTAVQLTGLTGAYTDIDDDPSNPDSSWLLVA